MTGVVITWSADRHSGTIMGEDGVPVRFESDAILAQDAMRLQAGKPVTFELANQPRNCAVNVCLRPMSGEIRSGQPVLRYMGFEQSAGVREYHFQRIVPGELAINFKVFSEVALFTRNRVALQEGPALCLLRLKAELDRVPVAGAAAVIECRLGEPEMRQYLDAKQEAVKQRSQRHVHRPAPAAAAAKMAGSSW
jgi:cold shock CspA family protein